MSKKRSSIGADTPAVTGTSTSLEEQRKRARLWKEQQFGSSPPAESPPASPTPVKKRPNRRASMSAAEPATRAAAKSSTREPAAASSRKSLAPQMLTRRGAPATVTAAPAKSASPPPKRARVAAVKAEVLPKSPGSLSVEEQRERARRWKEQHLSESSAAPAPAAAKSNRRKSAGAESTPQQVFQESEIPASLRPSRETSAAKVAPPSARGRRASMGSVQPKSPTPAAKKAAIRASIAVGTGGARTRAKTPATPEYESPSEDSEEETLPLIRSSRRSTARKEPARATFSAARRSSTGSTAFDESLYSYPADFRHQFTDRRAEEMSSPETNTDLSPLVRVQTTPGSANSRVSSRRTSSIKKNLIPSDSGSDDEEVTTTTRISFSQQKERAKQWRDSNLSSSPGRVRASVAATDEEQIEDDPNAIELAEPPEVVAMDKLTASQQVKKDAWFGEVMCFFSGVLVIVAFMAVRVITANDVELSFSFPLVPVVPSLVPSGEVSFEGLRTRYYAVVDTLSNGVEFTLASLRAVTLALLAVTVVSPVFYGLFNMAMWCWKNAQRKSNLIETMADESKNLLFNKYEGGPYPVVFLMETLMDKYRREGSGRANELLSPGETLNRAAFRKLWPSVEKEVQSDARIQVLNRTFEGKIHVCWRVAGGQNTVHSTHIAGDFATDDYGHEDAHSTSSYTPAKVHGAGVSFL